MRRAPRDYSWVHRILPGKVTGGSLPGWSSFDFELAALSPEKKKKKQQAITSLVDQSSCDAARASLTFTAGRWCSLLNFNSITEHQYHTGLLCNGNGTRVRQLQSRIWIQRKIQHCSVYKNNWISLYHG